MAGRLFGKSKPKQPAPQLTEVISTADSRAETIDKKISILDQKISKLKQQASKLRDGPAKNRIKAQAIRFLKQRRMYEQQYNMAQQQAFNMEQTANALQSMKEMHMMAHAMKDSQRALQGEMKKMDLNSMEDLQDEIADMMEEHQEVQEIFSRSYGMDDIDEDELNAEFEAFGEELEDFDDSLFEDLSAPTTEPAAEPVAPAAEGVDDFGLPTLQ
jgi:charged multivesicular body protein 5